MVTEIVLIVSRWFVMKFLMETIRISVIVSIGLVFFPHQKDSAKQFQLYISKQQQFLVKILQFKGGIQNV